MQNKVFLRSKIYATLIGFYICTLFFNILSINVKCIFMVCLIFSGNILCSGANYVKSIKLSVLFFIIAFIYSSLDIGLNTNMVIVQALTIISAIVMCGMLKKLSYTQMKFLTFLVLSLFLYSILWTYYYLLVDPMYIRLFGYVNNNEFVMPFYAAGLDYGNGEGLAIVLPAFLCLSMNAKNIILKITCLIIVISGIVVQLMATLTTSALLSIIFCVVILTMYIISSKRKIPLVIILTLSLFIAVSIFSDFTLSDNVQLIMKMEDVNDSFSSGHSTGQVESRFELYWQSISVFISNPIFGLGKVPTTFGIYDDKTVSLHTTVFDYLGMYGLFSFLLFLAWKNVIAENLKKISEEKRKFYKWAIVSLISLLCLKGPVSIGINFIFSTLLIGVLCWFEYYQSDYDIKIKDE